MKWLSYPIPLAPGDLPHGASLDSLLASRSIAGVRASRVDDKTAAEHLSNPTIHCRESTDKEIEAELAREGAARDAAAADDARRTAEVQARADAAKRHA